ncbi:LysR family transcriptional regulator [Photobacterium aquae]|uniref:LysR family transcriptional regulator n=1 Tax=Photobacterium aquae TaxID=1195763 RepID=A0A0J1GWE7_9GAMM|nr:LysR family transcriptional regulator [Photobacterium aquae]KLV04020.1 LysR family transcriptional regulator [Photobacterium aquae]
MKLKTTLDQWQTLDAIHRAGSIQAAATLLNKSHTTLIYSVKKLEEQLGVTLLNIQGRKSVLNATGQLLLRRASAMLEQAHELEIISHQLSRGIESEITVAVDHLCDPRLLYQAIAHFAADNSTTSVQVIETSLSKTQEMVKQAKADVAIINLPVTNFPAQAFGMTKMLPVISCHHPLATASSISLTELSAICQIVVRDLGGANTANQSDNDGRKTQDVGWLKSSQRITVDNFDHAMQAVEQGCGYCRLPEHLIHSGKSTGIAIINVEHASCYQVPLHLTLPKGANTGPAALALYDALLRTSFV